MNSYYDILEIDKKATPNEISKAYRSLAKKNHPDRGGSADRMVLINLAYEVLGNEVLKREYDKEIKNVETPFKNTYEDTTEQNTNKSDGEFYWENSTYHHDFTTEYTERVSEIFYNQLKDIKNEDAIYKKVVHQTVSSFGKELKRLFRVGKEDYEVCVNEIFPDFIKAGFTLAAAVRSVIPDFNKYWDEFYRLFISIFNESIYDYLKDNGYQKVESLFPADFNIIGLEYFNKQKNYYQINNPKIDFDNPAFICILATLFIYGYQLETSRFQTNKFKNENPAFAFIISIANVYAPNKKVINFSLMTLMLIIFVISLTIYVSTF